MNILKSRQLKCSHNDLFSNFLAFLLIPSTIIQILIIFYVYFAVQLNKKRLKCYKVADIFSATVNGQTKGCISYMMPVFNKAKYLNRSIGSILKQNYRCLEVIAVNDASTDNSIDILNYWRKQDKRVIVHTSSKNQGIMITRIQGVLLSYYDYLFSIDPDDKLPKNSLNQYINYALKTNSDMVMGQIMAIDGNRKYKFNWKMVKRDLNKTEMISLFSSCQWGWTIFRLVKRKVFIQAVLLLISKYYVPIVRADDRLLMGVAILFANNYSYFPKPTYIYYQYLPDSSGTDTYSKQKYSNVQSESLVYVFLQTLYPNISKCI